MVTVDVVYFCAFTYSKIFQKHQEIRGGLWAISGIHGLTIERRKEGRQTEGQIKLTRGMNK